MEVGEHGPHGPTAINHVTLVKFQESDNVIHPPQNMVETLALEIQWNIIRAIRMTVKVSILFKDCSVEEICILLCGHIFKLTIYFFHKIGRFAL